MGGAFADAGQVEVDLAGARVYEHGWQSWSPSTAYALGQLPWRPGSDARRLMNYRPDRAPADVYQSASVYQGEGLLAVEAGPGGPVHVAAATPGPEVASIRAEIDGATVRLSADGPIDITVDGGGLEGALGRWAERFAAAAGAPPPRPAPTIWCSWYHYFDKVGEADVLENLDAIGRLGLPVDVVQLDDGYEAEIGDWLTLSGRFGSLPGLVDRIRASGRRAGIWIAPFLVGERSAVAAEHPDWLVGGAEPGTNWGQRLHVLDVTNPGAAEYLGQVLATMAGWGIDFFKIDFIYAGAIDGRRHDDLPGIAAYQAGLRLIRRAIGPDAYLLGCGAPILPSVGLVDAMRVSPDTGPEADPAGGDMSQPSSRAAILTGAGRAWQHGRFWVNDADCLLARPAVQEREAWAAHVERHGGLRGSSDRLADLDGWGLETTRRLLGQVPDPVPFGVD